MRGVVPDGHSLPILKVANSPMNSVNTDYWLSISSSSSPICCRYAYDDRWKVDESVVSSGGD
jgi:hypothetical protein